MFRCLAQYFGVNVVNMVNSLLCSGTEAWTCNIVQLNQILERVYDPDQHWLIFQLVSVEPNPKNDKWSC